MAKDIDLVWAREHAGLTQAQAAELFGISRSAYGQWENGTTKVREGALEALRALSPLPPPGHEAISTETPDAQNPLASFISEALASDKAPPDWRKESQERERKMQAHNAAAVAFGLFLRGVLVPLGFKDAYNHADCSIHSRVGSFQPAKAESEARRWLTEQLEAYRPALYGADGWPAPFTLAGLLAAHTREGLPGAEEYKAVLAAFEGDQHPAREKERIRAAQSNA